MKRFAWLSYDLSVGGDYDGLYAWLDDHAAKEAGDSVAVFWFDYEKNFYKELKESLSQSVALKSHDRIYVVATRDGKAKGRFLFGKRRAPPWAGRGSASGESEEDAG